MEQQKTTAPAPGQQYMPYLPGLDGLRALAVIAVILYHAGLELWGGFLGVETFFTLSGFLITALLLAEWRRDGRVDLRRFWQRRFRRLLPALLLLLAGTGLIALAMPPGEISGLPADTLAALGYVINWHLILGEQSYFDPFLRPSLLRHLWSLAVEEQFYLLWPLLFVGGMLVLRRLGLLAAVVAGAVASTLAMALIYDPSVDPSRVYYGTDTRAAGLLVGVALALVWSPGAPPAADKAWAGRLLDLLGLLGLAGLLAAYALFRDQDPRLYRGGFALVSGCTALLVAAVSHPQARLLPRLLGWAPLRWVGARSYGLYLWHWPIFMVSRPGLDLPAGPWELLLPRLLVVVLLAELSYRLVERPIREHGLAGAWARLRDWRERRLIEASMRRVSRRPLWHGANIAVVASLTLVAASCGSAPLASPPAERTPTVAITSGPAPTAVQELVANTATIAQPSETPAPIATPGSTSTATLTATPAASPTPDITATAAASPPVDEELAELLQGVLDRTVADGYIPGATLTVIVPGRQPWTGTAGVADRDSLEPMTAEHRTRIASISKTFTAVVVLQLVEEGVLSLDQPISEWLGGIVPLADQLTIRDALQHTTGLYDYLEDRNYVGIAYTNANRVFAPAELVEYAARFPALFAPGSGGWDYASTNYVILGMVVEAATGNSLAEEMRSRIFEPLGLDGTFFAPDEQVEGPFATGYSRSTLQREVSMTFAYATANLIAPSGDVARFGDALFRGDLLKPESLELMLSFVSGRGQYGMPSLEYGLGVMRNVLPVGPAADGSERPAAASQVIGHIGGYGGFRSALWHDPDSGITIALGVNQAATDPNLLATSAWDAILDWQGR